MNSFYNYAMARQITCLIARGSNASKSPSETAHEHDARRYELSWGLCSQSSPLGGHHPIHVKSFQLSSCIHFRADWSSINTVVKVWNRRDAWLKGERSWFIVVGSSCPTSVWCTKFSFNWPIVYNHAGNKLTRLECMATVWYICTKFGWTTGLKKIGSILRMPRDDNLLKVRFNGMIIP